MGLISKLLAAPFISYFLTIITVAVLGSVMDRTFITQTLDNSALTVFLVWLPIVMIATILFHHFKRSQ